jgi:transposase-like protein
MDHKKRQAMTGELAKDLKTPEDLSQLSAFLTKLTVEAALKEEINNHLGYIKNASEGHHSGNSRNGKRVGRYSDRIGQIRSYFFVLINKCS